MYCSTPECSFIFLEQDTFCRSTWKFIQNLKDYDSIFSCSNQHNVSAASSAIVMWGSMFYYLSSFIDVTNSDRWIADDELLTCWTLIGQLFLSHGYDFLSSTIILIHAVFERWISNTGESRTCSLLSFNSINLLYQLWKPSPRIRPANSSIPK